MFLLQILSLDFWFLLSFSKMKVCLFVILTFTVLAMNAHAPALLLRRDCFYFEWILHLFHKSIRYVCVGLA